MIENLILAIFVVFIILFLVFSIKQSYIGKLRLVYKDNPTIKYAPIGYSWTTFIFSSFPALFRGHFVAVIVMLLFFPLGLISSATFGFFYNKWYVKWLISKGYKVSYVEGDLQKIQEYLKIQLPLLENAGINKTP